MKRKKVEWKEINGKIKKKCTKCSQWKQLHLFDDHEQSTLGKRAMCKACRSRIKKQSRSDARKLLGIVQTDDVYLKHRAVEILYNSGEFKNCQISSFFGWSDSSHINWIIRSLKNKRAYGKDTNKT